MNIKDLRSRFEKNGSVYEKGLLKFQGVEGYDVYNTSLPFLYQGNYYIFGRVERRWDWARSTVRLFMKDEKDLWHLVPDAMTYQMEDPFLGKIGDEFILGGTRVNYSKGKLSGFCNVFYKGTNPFDLYYYTTGPKDMKDIRFVQLQDGRLGVFTRPRGEEIRMQYGSESIVGFIVIDNISELDEEILTKARIIEGLFDKDEWGGCNQCVLLENGNIGVIGHRCYFDVQQNTQQQVYLNFSFIFDPKTFQVSDQKVIGTRKSFPDAPAKRSDLMDCAFTTGIQKRTDGKYDLYSGIGDVAEGRIVINYPFD